MIKPRFLAAVGALGILGAGLTACATGFQADVSRFQAQLPAPQGQTFAVVGYVPGTPANADLIVRFDYDVDNGRERVRSTGTGFRDPFYDPWYRYRAGAFVPRGYWGYGYYDPWLSSSSRIDSYTVYTSEIDLDIDDRRTGQRLFEGTAKAVSPSDNLQYLVPNLVDAMFTGFPGNSGETVRISIKPEER